ncbi:MAG: hypothetical protein D6773_11975 [Alphaproteobacteria bacterium]|nr:MAG: hypothetical protein D6773_11975 [Alphaproteobacteria bacterium]
MQPNLAARLHRHRQEEGKQAIGDQKPRGAIRLPGQYRGFDYLPGARGERINTERRAACRHSRLRKEWGNGQDTQPLLEGQPCGE